MIDAQQAVVVGVDQDQGFDDAVDHRTRLRFLLTLFVE